MKVVAWDTETKGLSWFREDEQAFLATWADSDGEYAADLSTEEGVGRFVAALDEADVLIAHNASFDAHQTRATVGYDVLTGHELHDTDILSRIVAPAGAKGGESHKLKKLSEVWLRADAGDAERVLEELAERIGTKLKTKGGYYDLYRAYPDDLVHYAKEDVRLTYDLFERLHRELDEDGQRCYDLERKVQPILIRAEERGVAVDQAAVSRLRTQYEAQRDEAYAYLEQEFGAQALGGKGSEEALLEALLGMGIPLHRRTDTGKLSTNQYALQEFEDEYPQLAVLSELRQAEKFLSTYIGPMTDVDVVHPSFRQCGAWTGRMSCSRPNMQNIPKRAGKEVRSAFIPRPGHAFVIVDYESIEVRLLAHYLGDTGFRQLIEDGHDPHAWMAANIHGGDLADYEKGTEGQAKRDKAKNTLFAITYGAGGPRVADMNKITVPEARALISKIKSSLPNYHRLNERIRNKVETVGHVNTLFGRKQPVNRDKAYVGLNALIQGSAADVMKQGLVNVDAAVFPLGGVPLLVVHDEVVVEVPQEHATEALKLTEAALIAAYDLTPALAVAGSIVTTSYADG